MTKPYKPKRRKKVKEVQLAKHKTILFHVDNYNILPVEFWCNSNFLNKLEKFSETQKVYIHHNFVGNNYG